MTLRVILIPGFKKNNLNLQPWKYFFEIALAFSKKDEVFVITNGEFDKKEIFLKTNITIIETKFFSYLSQLRLKKLIDSFDTDEIFWSISPLSIFFILLILIINKKIFAVVTCPLYSMSDVLKALIAGVNINSMRSIFFQTIIPNIFFQKLLNINKFRKIILLSDKNKNVLKSIGVRNKKLNLIRVGIQKKEKDYAINFIKLNRKTLIQKRIKKEKINFLFLGSPRKIRGFYMTINSFALASKKINNANLKLLARRDKLLNKAKIESYLKNLNIMDKVVYDDKLLSHEAVVDEIKKADVILLPFILVPSDIPIAILESMSYGKLIITSDLDGLPEMVLNRGIVIKNINKNNLANVIVNVCESSTIIDNLGMKAATYISNYPTWSETQDTFLKVLT